MRTAIIGICVTLLLPAVVFAQSQPRTVEVTAEGISPVDAKERALRKALEEGGETFISSRSQTENFELIRDTIYTKAHGILRDIEVLEEKPVIGGTHLCRLKAVVLLDVLAEEWGNVQAILEASGNPRIIVTLRERIDGKPQEYSTIEAKISGYLARKGFMVLDAEQVKRIAERHNQRFDIADMTFLQWVARNQGADVFIQGSSSASFARWHSLGGANVAIYNCNADISMFNTDDASLIVREHIPQFQGAARTDRAPSIEAGKMALEKAGEELFDRIYREAVRKWIDNIGGSREITFEVRAVPALGVGIRMENMLREIDGVTNVRRRYDSQVATFYITSKMSANVLSNHLVMGDWENIVLIEEQQRNVIRGAYVGPAPARP